MESQEPSVGIKQFLLILKRRWLPTTVEFLLIFSGVVLAMYLTKPIYVAEGKLLLKKTSSTPSLTGLGKEIGNIDPVNQQSSPLDTEAEILLSVPMTEETIAKLSLKDDEGTPLKRDQFLKNLSVRKVESTDILKVTYKDREPKRAAAVVNTLIDNYLQNNILLNRAETKTARQFIEQQLPQAEATMHVAELGLRRFKERNQVVALDEEAKSAVTVIADFQKQITEAKSKLADVTPQTGVFQSSLGMNSKQALTAASLSQSPGVQEVLTELQKVQSDLAVGRTRYTEEHPNVVNLKRKEAALNTILQQRIAQVVGSQQAVPTRNLQVVKLKQDLTTDLVKLEATRLGLANQITALTNVQDAYKQRLTILPKLEQQQRELERKLQVSQSTYSLLLQKLQEIRLAENQTVGNARLVSRALVPEKPVAPRKSLYLGAGLLLSSLISLATALILEASDKSVRTVEEAKELLGYTLLGVIPSLGKSKKMTQPNKDSELSVPELVVRDNPRSPTSESYRMLHANLKFLSSDKPLKAIVVTSAVPQEGKSTVSANLAAAMAQRERKVLLVDADLYCPLQHHIWDVPNQVGLSNVLVGEVNFKTAIKEVMSNLSVLTAGVMPPSPAALLDSRRMAALIEDCSSHYDFVIVDAPSLSVAADAPVLGRMADGVLLVVRPGVVDSVSATSAKEVLKQSGQNVLGLVVNGVVPAREPHSYYYFAKEYYAEKNLTAYK
ncbi:MAG TPA: polysaccharide biosynthesis tyrosine autokinase [Waterburya sp.]|jgi:capsular exopolysaccharide synthesis family protein